MVYEPDAFVIRFGYDDQRSEWGDGFDEAWYSNNLPGNMQASERGISFRRPIFDNDRTLTTIVETLHLGRDKFTFGCALDNYMTRGKNMDEYTSLVTIAPFDWKLKWGTGKNLSNETSNYLKKIRLSIMGGIQTWGGNVNKSNYTLSHHCETNEDRDWDALKGRLLSFTGEPGGNNHGD